MSASVESHGIPRWTNGEELKARRAIRYVGLVLHLTGIGGIVYLPPPFSPSFFFYTGVDFESGFLN